MEAAQRSAKSGLSGSGWGGLVVFVPRDAATAAQVLHDAASQAHDHLGDVLVGERRGLVEGRSRAGIRRLARIGAIDDQHVKVQVEIQSALESLRQDHRTGAAALDALRQK